MLDFQTLRCSSCQMGSFRASPPPQGQQGSGRGRLAVAPVAQGVSARRQAGSVKPGLAGRRSGLPGEGSQGRGRLPAGLTAEGLCRDHPASRKPSRAPAGQAWGPPGPSPAGAAARLLQGVLAASPRLRGEPGGSERRGGGRCCLSSRAPGAAGFPPPRGAGRGGTRPPPPPGGGGEVWRPPATSCASPESRSCRRASHLGKHFGKVLRPPHPVGPLAQLHPVARPPLLLQALRRKLGPGGCGGQERARPTWASSGGVGRGNAQGRCYRVLWELARHPQPAPGLGGGVGRPGSRHGEHGTRKARSSPGD